MADGKSASFKGRNSFTSKKLGFSSKMDGCSSPLSPGEVDAEGEPWGAGGTGGGGAGPQRKLPPRSKSRFGRAKGGSDDEGDDDGLDLSDGDMEAGADSAEAESQLKSVPSIATDDFISYSTKAKKKKGDISSLGGKSFTKFKKMMAAKPVSDEED